ncbi:winged helix-turn-helix transcriptional regulator [Salmonella enterica]|nr:winged helix-turn-helix transcriptional regulator [Salmonella enterica]
MVVAIPAVRNPVQRRAKIRIISFRSEKISIERLGPIGVVELAERAGRDYTTVSRQVAKLEKLGLIIRQHNAIDRRIREAVISRTGKAMTERIDAAREQMGNVVFKDWPQDEIDIFVRLMQKFADAMDSDASMPE